MTTAIIELAQFFAEEAARRREESVDLVWGGGGGGPTEIAVHFGHSFAVGLHDVGSSF